MSQTTINLAACPAWCELPDGHLDEMETDYTGQIIRGHELAIGTVDIPADPGFRNQKRVVVSIDTSDTIEPDSSYTRETLRIGVAVWGDLDIDGAHAREIVGLLTEAADRWYRIMEAGA